MPYVRRKPKAKKSTKRVYKSKVPRPVFKTNVNIGRGLPKKMTMVHKFNERGSIVNVGGTPSTIATVEYYTNNMFRVNKTTGATHQPLYFDQMMLIYNTFTVIGSKIKVTFMATATGTTGQIVGMFVNDKVGAIVPTLTSTMVEQTGAKSGLLNPDAGSKVTRTYTWSAKKRVGGSVLGNNDLSGSNTASPVETNSYVLYMQDFLKTTANTVSYMVEIEYIAVWTGLRDVSGS